MNKQNSLYKEKSDFHQYVCYEWVDQDEREYIQQYVFK